MNGFAITYVQEGTNHVKIFIRPNGQFCIYDSYAEAASSLARFLPNLDEKSWPKSVVQSVRVTEISMKKA